jgi:penicillin-binding protein 2
MHIESLKVSERKRRHLSVVCALILVAVSALGCTPVTTQNTPSTITANATATGNPDLPSALPVLQLFVDSINGKDYRTAYSLLNSDSARICKDAESLQGVYESAQAIATANSVTYVVRAGILQDGKQALTLVVSTWQTILLGSFTATSTLTMTYESDAWRIGWTRDLVLPGMGQGRLILNRQTTQRGAIYAADNSPLAVQSEYKVIGISPGAIKDANDEKDMLSALSQFIGLSPAEIKKKYADAPGNWFVPITTVDEDTLAKNSKLIERFDAVSVRTNYSRSYPQGNIAPHVVGYIGSMPPASIPDYQSRGYTGDELVGLSGVEGYLNETLNGRAGGTLQTVSENGDVINIVRAPGVPGRDITLTISPTLQSQVQQVMGKRIGAAVVIRPADGAILAMASYPTFDSSIMLDTSKNKERIALLTDNSKPLLNRAIQGTYPAGSTFKMVTMAAGMGENLTSPDDMFSDPGYWDGLGGGYRKTCWLRGGHGRISLQDGLTASCDVVFYTVGKRLDDKSSDILPQYAEQFGFGSPTGVELVGESAGIMPDPTWKQKVTGDVWTPGDTVNLAIGQGFMLATPLQVTQVTAAIANNGVLLKPHVVSAIGLAGDEHIEKVEPVEIRKLPVTPTNLQAMKNAMKGVTTNTRIGTTVSRFSSMDYYIVDGRIVSAKSLSATQRANATRFIVAGKSGTAQAPGVKDKPFAWFTAYAPADDPQIAVTVLLENVGEGSSYAAPLVRQIIESYFGLPISNLPANLQPTD